MLKFLFLHCEMLAERLDEHGVVVVRVVRADWNVVQLIAVYATFQHAT